MNNSVIFRRWWAGPWQHCSASCGSRGLRKRTVICVRSLNRDQQIALLDEDCEEGARPPELEPCPHKRPCHGERETWAASQWSDVSYKTFTCSLKAGHSGNCPGILFCRPNTILSCTGLCTDKFGVIAVCKKKYV